MSEERLNRLIEDFSYRNLNLFLRGKCENYAEAPEDLPQYDDERFTDFQKLGEIRFDSGDKLVITSSLVNGDLTERSGKKAQYEKAKKILKELAVYDAGFFIFHDSSGSFRFSLVYGQAEGTRRSWNNFRRFTYFVSKDQTNKTFRTRVGGCNFLSLEAIKDAFSVEKVTKAFYSEIANWYFWAVRNVTFPKNAETEANGRNNAVIRLITRLIFIWFMKERKLVSPDLFNQEKISSLLKSLKPDETTYYKAVLQNLFFATLNTKIEERKFRFSQSYQGKNKDYMEHGIYRYEDYFKNREDMLVIFKDIPFLNGGLFDCLDWSAKESGTGAEVRFDGFSDKEIGLKVPNYLFFSAEREADLNTDYGTKNKKYHVQGLLKLLSAYNFTIDENDPNDQEVALDPELLGKVFENLLASFNPETATTARKATGSYYTPREIVDYMVTQSLKQYYRTHLGEIDGIDSKLDELLSPVTDEAVNPFGEADSQQIVKLTEALRIVDPAVGSGAFPMGILNKLVSILYRVDPDNKLWQEAQLKAVDDVPDPLLKQKLKKQINEQFAKKNSNYGRKLYLIQKCIYGVDIQQSAIEIAKLRFFIALLVDEDIDKSNPDNWGIEPLPNLDFKLMQGNSLISEFMGINLDAEDSNSYGKLMKEETDELITQYQNKKGEFQYEPDRKKKEALKNEIDKLIEQIFESKLKTQKAEYYTTLKNIERKYTSVPDIEQRNEAIRKDTETLNRNYKFDLAQAEKQLKEFTTGLKVKPFFAWKLYFAEVFHEKGGFDIVIANPPYVRADSSEKHLVFRENLEKSGDYQTLYEKWDLMIPFVERGLRITNTKGELIYIASNAICTSKYASKLLDLIQKNYYVRSIDYFEEMQVFEAGVIPVVLHVGKTNGNGITKRIVRCDSFDNIKSRTEIPTGKFKALGRDAFRKEYSAIAFTTQTVNLGDICYISYGLRPNSDERYWKGEFTANDVISEVKDKIHNKQYIEGKDISNYLVNRIRYLEWGTDRVPKKLVRPTFPELYNRPKIMRGCVTPGVYDETGLLCNHSIVVFVKFTDLHGVENKSIQISIKKFNRLLRLGLEKISERFDLKYLLAIINSSFAFKYLNNIRRHRLENYFYPDDFRKLPIPDILEQQQQPLVELVDRIMALTQSDDHIQNPTKKAKVKEYERQIDQMVYELYGLTPEEIAVVEGRA